MAWTWLEEHHAVASLLTTIIFGVVATYVSCRVAAITDDQRRIQELSVTPQIIFECRPSEHQSPPDTGMVDLLVENVGGPLNRLSITLTSFMPLRLNTPGQRDAAFAIVPLVQYFGPIAATHRPQGEIAMANATSFNASYAWIHAGTTYDSTDIVVRPQRAHHLIHLIYLDGLRHRTSRYVILNEHDFWDVPEDNAQPLLDTLSARSKAGWTLVLADGMSKERILGVGRAMRPVLRQDRALLRAVELGQ